MGKKREGGYLGATPATWSASVRPGMWNLRSQYQLNKEDSWPEPPPEPSGTYEISRSVRFNSSDSAFLSRVVTGSTTTYTASMWVKRSAVGNGQYQHFFFSKGGDGSGIGFDPADKITVYNSNHNLTDAVYRDPSAWYHIVLSVNAGTAALYVNNVLAKSGITGFSWSGTATIGRYNISNAYHFNGYIADVYLIDGQALTPSSFTEVSTTTGQLIPKAYTGSFGTNGFWLKFSDNSAATATTLGKDYSGNNNNWSPSNLSVTAGAGNDSLVDTPSSYGTDTGAGGEVRGNYATLNPLNYTGTVTLSNGNLDASGSNANASSTIAPNAGKWYAEFVYSAIGAAVGFVGISNRLGADAFNGATQTWQLNYTNTGKLENAGSQSTVSTFTTGDVVGVAFDCSNGQATFYKNGSSVGTITGSAFVGVPVLIGTGAGGAAGTNTFVANFGQRPFAYTAPSGFKALCDTNLPAPVVAKPNEVMDVKTYTGTGSAQTISGIGFSPDLVWIKERNNVTSHCIFDSVRGTSKVLSSNNANSEDTTTALSAFNSDGFSLLTPNAGGYAVGDLNDTYVAWTWDAGSSTVTNTQGSITSSCRTNQSSGFSIVSYTGNGGSNVSVGHGLNVAPVLLIVKSRSTSGDWDVTYTFGDGSYDFMSLNTTAAKLDITGRSAPTSTLFYVNGGLSNVNGTTYVAYAWTPVAGYTSMGSYVGDGSTSGFGPFIHCGFRPKFVLIKSSSVAYSWLMFDSVRNPYNLTTQVLYADSSTAEMTNNGTGSGGYESIDILSNGFQIKSNSSRYNQSGATYIYFAVAESPFQYARAR